MNMILIIAAIILGLVFLGISLFKPGKETGISKWAQRSFKQDAKSFAVALVDLIKGFAVMFGWLAYMIFDIFKSFVYWMRSKKENKQNRNPGDLWCPRCKAYFDKSHKCFIR